MITAVITLNESSMEGPNQMLRILLAAFNPRYWPLFVQQIRTASDFTPAMLPIAIIGTLGFSSGLLSRIPFAHPAFVASLSPLMLVAIIGSTLAMYDSLAAVLRGGLRGFAVANAWFDISRATLIAGILLSVTSIALLYFGLPTSEITGVSILILFVSFIVGSLVGYILSARGQYRSSGSAFECSDFFLPQFLAGAAVVIPVILLGKHFDPMWIIGYTVVSALTLAALLKAISWKRASQ